MDDSHHQISLALWGKEFCEEHEHLKTGDIIAVKCAKVSDYGGKSLNAASEHAHIVTDLPDNAKFTKVTTWFQNLQDLGEAETKNAIQGMTTLTERREPRENDGGSGF